MHIFLFSVFLYQAQFIHPVWTGGVFRIRPTASAPSMIVRGDCLERIFYFYSTFKYPTYSLLIRSYFVGLLMAIMHAISKGQSIKYVCSFFFKSHFFCFSPRPPRTKTMTSLIHVFYKCRPRSRFFLPLCTYCMYCPWYHKGYDTLWVMVALSTQLCTLITNNICNLKPEVDRSLQIYLLKIQVCGSRIAII